MGKDRIKYSTLTSLDKRDGWWYLSWQGRAFDERDLKYHSDTLVPSHDGFKSPKQHFELSPYIVKPINAIPSY